MKARLHSFLSVLLTFVLVLPTSALTGIELRSPLSLAMVGTVQASRNVVGHGGSSISTSALYLYAGEQFDPDLGINVAARYTTATFNDN